MSARKVEVPDVGAGVQAAQRHLGQDHRLLVAHFGFLDELLARALEQIERELGGGPEASPLHQDRLSVEHFGGLHDVARRGEHGGVGQPALHQLQGHEPVIDPGEGRAGEPDHVDLDALPGEIVDQ